jgi:hypothetical protein
MKYTKAFEKYYKNTKPMFHNLELYQWEQIKIISFHAWKAGQRKTKEDYNLINRDYVRILNS